MSDIDEKSTSVQQLRRIVRPTPIARQRKMMIGRIAANSQMMANSFGRSTSIRRSLANESSVRFPTWLLPALPDPADDLDPYRDRDIIALRQSRMKNRVVRQVQPRGLPMAAHARGRSRSGIQTGPSSIARRLHPIRRQPNRNEAHIGPTSAPLVRVATQQQRLTARPPRTRSTKSPTRNGNRTDRDGPTPPARRFESVLVARSVLSSSQSFQNSRVGPHATDATSAIHRLSLPRVSSRQSIDRSSIHRRAIPTRQPAAIPRNRIPLSLMYEPPHRLGMTSSTSTTPRQTSTTKQPTTSARRLNNPALPASSATNWTSFPSRDSAPNNIVRKNGANTSIVPTASSSIPPAISRAVATPPTTSLSTAPSTLSTIESATNTATPSSRDSGAILASTSTPISSAQRKNPSRAESRTGIPSRNASFIRRQVRRVNIPRSPGWRQVVGLSNDETPQQVSNPDTPTRDSLFRRIAALANPLNTPLGTPGDIARRSPVSGSLIALASSMQVARRENQRPVSTQASSQRHNQPAVSRRATLSLKQPLQPKQTSGASRDGVTANLLAQQASQSVSPDQKVSSHSMRIERRQSRKRSSSSNLRSSSSAAQLAVSRSAIRNQKANASPLASSQKPAFLNLWSSVNHSISRQSDLVARRSLRLPQPRIHSHGSKPGAILRRQFGLDHPVSSQVGSLSPHLVAHDLRIRKTHRTNHALQTGTLSNPSTARVMSVARQTRSHMSSITPGASGGVQFAGSLAKAISHRQTQGNGVAPVTLTRVQQSPSASRSSTATPPSIQRAASTTRKNKTSDWSNGSTPITGAGAHVAQNFLDRLSKKTVEDFAPVGASNQEGSISTNLNDDAVSRRVSRSANDAKATHTSDSSTQQDDTFTTITPTVTNGTVMRSIMGNASHPQSESRPIPTTMSPNSREPQIVPGPYTTSLTRSSNTADAVRTRQEIVERGGSIASRGVLRRSVSRSVPTERLSSPLHDLPVSPNVTPGMRIPAESLSAVPITPAAVAGGLSAATTSPTVASASRDTSVISRSVSSNSTPISRSTSVRREGRRSLSIQRQASGIPLGPSDDGTISADALVRMIESGQSLPNQVVHRQVSGTSSSGLIRAQRSSGQVLRSGGSSVIQRRPSSAEKAAPGPVSILSQVLAPSDDSGSGTNQITTSQLLDLMDWINRIVDDRLRQELERRGVAGGRW